MKSLNFKIIKININEETSQTLWDKDEDYYFYNRNLVTNQNVEEYNLQKISLINKFQFILKDSWYTGGLILALKEEDLEVDPNEIMPEYVYIYTKDGDTIADASIVFDNFIIIMRLTQKKLTETLTSI